MRCVVVEHEDRYEVLIADGWTIRAYAFDVETGRVVLVDEVAA